MSPETLLRDLREAQTPEEAAGALSWALQSHYAMVWYLYDACHALVEGRSKEYVKAAARECGRGHRDLLRWADYSSRVPSAERDPLYAPLGQVKR